MDGRKQGAPGEALCSCAGRGSLNRAGHKDRLRGKARDRDLGHKICRLLSVLILVAVVAICIPMTVPQLMGYEVYVVVSGSMEPAIPVGSALYVEVVRPEEVGPGDVVAFYDRGAVITHRVVENHVVEGEFITKGDANAEDDMEPVAYGALIGRMVLQVPFLGSVMAVCSGTKGKIYLASAVLGAVLLLWAGKLLDRDGEPKG